MTSWPGSPVDLILVRHAHPCVQPDRPAGEWPISPEGMQAARILGEHLCAAVGPMRVVTSDERKAIRTGEAISGGAVSVDERLGEQGQGTVPFLPGDAFRERVMEHFRQPHVRVLGAESSADAVARFDLALRDALDWSGATVPVVVSHGRILSAWIAARVTMPETSIDAGTIWMQMRMPDVFLLRRAGEGWQGERFDTGSEWGG
ncbi:MAG: histidine phosphatase family protein [Thermomicrobiales bacterium]